MNLQGIELTMLKNTPTTTKCNKYRVLKHYYPNMDVPEVLIENDNKRKIKVRLNRFLV